MREILNPVCRLALKLQHQNAELCDIPDSLESLYGRLAGYIQRAADFFTDCGFTLQDSYKISASNIHTKVVKPHIEALTEPTKKCFDDNTTKCAV